MEALARITSKGQITIPKTIRDKIKAKKGDYLIFQVKGSKVEIEKASLSQTEEFEVLAEKLEKKFKEKGITKEDIQEAVKWARNQE